MLRFIEVYKAKSLYLEKVCVDMKLGGESNRSFSNVRKGNEEIISSFKKYNLEPQRGYTLRRWCKKVLQKIP